MRAKTIVFAAGSMLSLALAGWGGFRVYQFGQKGETIALPTTTVKRGDVLVTVTGRGELQGGNSEMLVAPMTGAREMSITFLRKAGELIKAGDVVVEFDKTEQEYALKEAEADLAEAEQQVTQAQADSDAREEEARYALLQAKAELKLAELEVRKNPVVGAIVAKQNLLALSAAQDKLVQLQRDLASRKATTEAGVAIQEAARNKAKVKADTARRNMESMTLKAKSAGYVAIQQNQNLNFGYWGMQLPMFQVGDNVRAGMGVAQIPDLENWEVVARLGELDRGHLEVGQPAEIEVVALPGMKFTGKIKNIGGTTGPPWDRRFECKMSIEGASAELRPGMSTRIVVTTAVLPKVLWVPSQALFESDGRKFVYVQSPNGFVPRDVKLVRRSESQVVLTGLEEGQSVAMASPDVAAKKKGPANAMQALPKS